jgi:FAD/FMN-containing dehydrogenase
MQRTLRSTWRNHTGNQSCQPLQVCEPDDLDELVALVRDAEADGVSVRAVGSGHSWSDVGLTGGFLVLPRGLAGDAVDVLRDGERPLVRVRAATRIRELNEQLWDAGYALPNMGGYDGQTVAGVISTSTHGSGLAYGPLPDLVRSLDIVAGGGRRVRLEPLDGPTDPADADGEGWELVRDDALFAAALVGMGCMGVIYAVVLEVRAGFRLTETRWITTWSAVRDELVDGRVAAGHDHYELLVNPYPGRDGEHRVMVTVREEPAVELRPQGDERERPRLNELLSSLPVTHAVIDFALDFDPDGIPGAMDRVLDGLVDDAYTDRSYRVLNIGAANDLPAYSSEIGVGLEGTTPRDAVETIFAVAAKHRRLGKAYATAPFALRFVRRSRAVLSMMHGRDTMMIELIMQTDTEGGYELLAAYEQALYRFGGRPHWGQFNVLTERRIEELYGASSVAAWRTAAATLDPAGTFCGAFSLRCGLR